MQENAPDFGVILEVLTKHKVDYIVVVGVCAVLLGAPVEYTGTDTLPLHCPSIINRREQSSPEWHHRQRRSDWHRLWQLPLRDAILHRYER